MYSFTSLAGDKTTNLQRHHAALTSLRRYYHRHPLGARERECVEVDRG